MTFRTKTLPVAVTVLKWLLPLTVLVFIIANIDFSRFLQGLSGVRPVYFILGLATFPLALISGAYRWTYLARVLVGERVPFGFMSKHYWFGVALGRFMPGSIGWDAYRVLVLGRRTGAYGVGAMVIMLEKIAGIACISLTFLLVYPLALHHMDRAWPFRGDLHLGVVIVVVASLFVLAAFSLLRRSRLLSLLMRAADRLVAVAASRTDTARTRTQNSSSAWSQAVDVGSLRFFGQLLAVTLLTLPTLLASGLAHNMFLRSLGQTVPYSANLLLVSLLAVVAFLPISLGNLGIREAAFIFFYGLFGVNMEISLLAALFILTGILLSDGLGVLVMMATMGRPGRGLTPAVEQGETSGGGSGKGQDSSATGP